MQHATLTDVIQTETNFFKGANLHCFEALKLHACGLMDFNFFQKTLQRQREN
jgi:hypothetical protein